MQALPFALDISRASFFEKAHHGAKDRFVAGILSTDRFDTDREALVQTGLDFSYFLSRGVLNDSHQRSVAAIVGYPEEVLAFNKGETLPDDTKATRPCTWAEGRLLQDDELADAVWKKGLALRGTPRALGFSLEGKWLARSADKRVVTKAEVYNAAVCAAPKNVDSTLALFTKALDASPDQLEEAWGAFAKALGLGEPSPNLPEGPVNAEEAARILAIRDQPRGKRKKRLSKAEAINFVLGRYPDLSMNKARRIVEVIMAAPTR